MHKLISPLVLVALFLTACTMQITTVELTSVIPTASPTNVSETQINVPTTPTSLVVTSPTVPSSISTEPGRLLYFWPASPSPDTKFNKAGSIYDDDGYVIEFNNPGTGAFTILRAGTEADRYPYCNGQVEPDRIRGLEGCSSMGTGAGASIEWKENGVHYSVGGLQNSLEAAHQFVNNLEVLDYQNWQQKFVDAVDTSATRARITFITGTTSNTSAYRYLAGGNSDEYIFGALAGQELSVNAAPYTFADAENFVLSVFGADGSILVSEAAQTPSWSGILPTTQEYVIRVTNQGNAADYQLKLSIPRRIKFAAGEISAILQGRLIPGMDGNTYLLQAGAGQTMTVTTISTNNNACLTLAAQLTDGSYVPLVNSNSHPTTTWRAVLPTGAEYSQDYSIFVSLCPNAPVADTSYTLFIEVTN